MELINFQNNQTKLNKAMFDEFQNNIKAAIDAIHPVGSIYISLDETNPSILFGGTWERLKGRTLVGLDEDDTDFNESGKVGGSKYIQDHKHLFRAIKDATNTDSQGALVKANNSVGSNNGFNQYSGGSSWIVGSVGDVQTGNSGNLQPYLVVYMWKRIG